MAVNQYQKRRMRQPELWIGRRIPTDLDYEYSMWIWMEYDKCDDCQCFYSWNDLHALLWPMSEADWKLQERVHVEEAESFCPACLRQIKMEADAVDPEWRERRWMV